MSAGKVKSQLSRAQKKQPYFILYGSADNFTFDTSASKLVNYTEEGIANAGSLSTVDASAGEITIPSTGAWKVTTLLIGQQGSVTKEESMTLQIDVDAAKSDIWVFDVATDKTTTRSFGSSFTRIFTAGEVVSLYCVASANMGTFTVDEVTFEIEKKI